MEGGVDIPLAESEHLGDPAASPEQSGHKPLHECGRGSFNQFEEEFPAAESIDVFFYAAGLRHLKSPELL